MTKFLTMAFLCLLLIVATISADSNYPTPPNIRVTNIPELNNEEQVFICPTDSNIVFANWRDFRLGYRQIGLGRSTDGGQTWVDSLIKSNFFYFGSYSQQSDPTMTVDRNGSFYMSALDWDAFGGSGRSTISFYRSDDKGLTWFGPYSVLNHFPLPNIFEDKQFITVDRTGGLHDGNLYCSWTRFYGDPNNRIVFARSLNGGENFEDTVLIGPVQSSTACGSNEYSAGQFSIPIVSSNGDLHVFWLGSTLDSGSCNIFSTIKHVVSTDGGASFTYEDTILTVSGWTSADGGINTYSQPVGDADIFGGPFDGNIYLAFTNIGEEDNSNSDVDFIYSSDNGLSWSERIQVNDSPNSTEVDAFHPWLVVNQEGIISVIFYDQRMDDPNYILFDLFAAYSFDGGQTFTVNHRISDVSSSPGDLKSTQDEDNFFLPAYLALNSAVYSPARIEPRAGLIGEYIGVTSFYDKHVAIWTDSRNGNSEVYSSNWYLPLLEPRILAPENNFISNSPPIVNWATSWKNDQDQYRVEYSLSSDFSESVTSIVVDTNYYQLPTTPDGVYFFRVKAFDITNNDSSDYSIVSSFEIDTSPPEITMLIEPYDNRITNNSMPFFDWSDVLKSPVTYTLLISIDNTFPVGPSTLQYDNISASEFTITDPLSEDVQSYWKIVTTDVAGNSSESAINLVKYINFVCGDVNNDGTGPFISDLTYLVAYLFQSGPPLPINASGDLNGDGDVLIGDLTALVNYLFRDGPEPGC